MQVLLLWTCLLVFSSCSAASPQVGAVAPSHQQWDVLVKKHVDGNGMVNYQGFLNDRDALQQYLDTLSAHHPDANAWSADEQLAYWINAYNAFTVELILRHYPVQSIKDVKRWNIPFLNTPWTIKFIELGGKTYDLDALEHKIIRKQFNEPRIHFALVCAAISCPKLRQEAYTAERLDKQLSDQARDFLNNPSKNEVTANQLELSAIFNWFKGDFTQNGSLIDFIRPYTDVDINPDATISFKSYSWQLNNQ